MANYVGEAIYKISYDPNTGELKSALNKTESTIEGSGDKSGKNWATAWNVAAGSLISKGVSKIASSISANLGSAIERVDTINNFPKVMQNLGINAADSSASINKLAEKLKGLPTSLQAGASAVQRFTSANGDVAKSTDLFLALNNAIIAGGQSSEIQSSALEQLSQAYAKGKPDMLEWRSAMTAMPAQLKQVAQAMGYVDATALGEDLRNGKLSMDDFMDTFVRLNKEGVDGFASFEKQARDATGGVGVTLQNLKNRIVAAIAEVINSIGSENIANFVEGLSNTIVGIGKAIADVIGFVSENTWVIGAVAGALAPIMAMGIFGKILALTSAFSPLKLAIVGVSVAIGVVAGLATAVIENWSGITTFFGEVFEGIGNIVSGAWEGLVNGAKGAFDGIKNIFGNLAGFFGSIFSNAWNAVKKVFSTGGKIFDGIKDGIVNAFKAIVNGIIGGINKVVAVPFNAINGILNGLRGINILGVQPFGWLGQINVPQIPRLATGGIVESKAGGSLIVAGEGGQDEWVVPESKMASLISKLNEQGAGMNITINVSGTFATSTSEQRKVAETIAQRIQEIQTSRLNAGGLL